MALTVSWGIDSELVNSSKGIKVPVFKVDQLYNRITFTCQLIGI
jgi:hypothetical protein